MQPHSPVSGGGNFIIFKVHEFVGGHIVGQYKTTLGHEHSGEDNAMKDDVIFSYEMNQFGILAFPVWGPVLPVLFGPFFGHGNVANRCIEPNVQYFSIGIW